MVISFVLFETRKSHQLPSGSSEGANVVRIWVAVGQTCRTETAVLMPFIFYILFQRHVLCLPATQTEYFKYDLIIDSLFVLCVLSLNENIT